MECLNDEERVNGGTADDGFVLLCLIQYARLCEKDVTGFYGHIQRGMHGHTELFLIRVYLTPSPFSFDHSLPKVGRLCLASAFVVLC